MTELDFGALRCRQRIRLTSRLVVIEFAQSATERQNDSTVLEDRDHAVEGSGR
jgi:hypothetical protein